MSQLYEITAQTEGSGIFMMGVAGEALGKHKLVYRAADSLWHLSDANATTTMIVYGITLEVISIGLRGKILLSGYIADAGWTWVVGGEAGLIFASGTPGELTQTPPGLPTDMVQGVAVALTTQAIFFHPPGYMGGGGGGGATAYGTTTVATGGTIAHGLGAVPTRVHVIAQGIIPIEISYTADNTNITVYHTSGGSPTVNWEAEV
jgi:hypothetical protein